jgi:hypothetical protein
VNDTKALSASAFCLIAKLGFLNSRLLANHLFSGFQVLFTQKNNGFRLLLRDEFPQGFNAAGSHFFPILFA